MCEVHAYGAPVPERASFCPSCEGERLAQRDRNRPRGRSSVRRRRSLDDEIDFPNGDDDLPTWSDY